MTTQNRGRLGNTVSELLPYLQSSSNDKDNNHVVADVDKTYFSMVTPGIEKILPKPHGENGPLDVIIVGIESHICVSQTTLDLLALGHRVYILADAVSSANPEERNLALARLRDAGAIVTSSESIIFEVLKDAKSPAFKEVSGLVKDSAKDTRESLEAFCAASKI